MLKQAVIIAGGEGKRLKKVTGDNPKILLDFDSKTLLEFQIEYLLSQDISNIHFCLGYGSNSIIKKIDELDIEYTYSLENNPLGTYGALQNAYDYLETEFFCLFGDIVLDYEISFGYKNFQKYGSDMHLILRYTNHPEDSDIVKIDEKNKVISIDRDLSYPYQPLGNTSLFFCKKSALDSNISESKKDIFKHFVKENIDKLNITSEVTLNFIRDIGTIERYEKEIDNYKNHISKEIKYIFIDRDNTIINNRGEDNNLDKFDFKPGAIDLIKTLQNNNCKLILVTNQPSIAKGFCTFEDVENLNSHLQHELIRNNLKPLDGIYYCPHHPEKGFAGEVKELKIKCICRKPNEGLVLNAIKELNIKNKNFYFVGDTLSDYLLAKKFGSKCLLVKSRLTEVEKLSKLNVKVYENLKLIEKEFIGIF